MESFNPSPQKLPFLRSLPYTANAAQRRRLNTSYLTNKNHIIKEYLKTPPLCFASQNIGEVARSDGGVKKQYSNVIVRFLHSSPAVSRSITGCHV